MTSLAEHLSLTSQAFPDALAVEFRGNSVTYSELASRSSAVAWTLIDAGIAPGDRVALWLNKSIEAIIILYGILKAGAAYVPLDPSAPTARATRIASNAQVRCVVTSADRLPLLEDSGVDPACTLISIDPSPTRHPSVSWEHSAAMAPLTNPLPEVSGDQPAYILHTSGSKGDPKGVLLTHNNSLAFVDWAVAEFRLRPLDRISAHAPLHFDLSVFDIFAACRVGACVVLVPESHVGIGSALNKFVVDRQISVWYSVPTALMRMVDATNSRRLQLSSLRLILFAGEVFPLGQLRQLSFLIPKAKLFNLYGPTESNVCTFHEVAPEDLAPGEHRTVPIGRPCPYADTFLVGPHGDLLDHEPGQYGELCVSGPSVMAGYWNDDLLTAQSKTDIPRPGLGSLRAYRTGDFVRLDDDLNYIFCGRADDQIKIRGNRVQLSEIEAILASMPGVSETACVVVGTQPDQVRIEAYITGNDLRDVQHLRQLCLRSLPRYMIPDKLYLVPALPRTGTGKIDRRALTAGE
jgi:amino acid adenylation domain-containing protein